MDGQHLFFYFFLSFLSVTLSNVCGGWCCCHNRADVDECALATDTCSSTQSCTNTDGSFSCIDCASGYEASTDGLSCVGMCNGVGGGAGG